MNDTERVKNVVKWLIYNNIAQNEKSLAELLGYTKSSFSQIVNGRVPLSKKFVDKLCSLNQNINSVWILSGEGEMLKAATAEPTTEVSKDYRLVPLINIDSVGGVHSQNLIATDEQYIMRHLAFSDAREGDVAILQTGNSMSPTIPSGSALLIRKVDGWQEFFGYGNIYVLLLADGRRITKEIRRYDADPQNFVWCVSYNPDVADEELPRSFIVEVWKVVKFLADFGW